MENIKQMRERHEKEVADLQNKCPHKNQKVHVYIHGWMMHGGGYEDYCEDCGKIIAHYRIPYQTINKGKGNFETVATGPEERIPSEEFVDWIKTHQISD